MTRYQGVWGVRMVGVGVISPSPAPWSSHGGEVGKKWGGSGVRVGAVSKRPPATTCAGFEGGTGWWAWKKGRWNVGMRRREAGVVRGGGFSTAARIWSHYWKKTMIWQIGQDYLLFLFLMSYNWLEVLMINAALSQLKSVGASEFLIDVSFPLENFLKEQNSSILG